MSPTDQDRSKNFGLLAAFGALSFLVSILCGDYFFNQSMSSPWAISFPFFIIAGLSFLILLIMLVFFRDTKPPKKNCKFNLAKGYHNIVGTLQNTATKNAYLVYFFFSAGWVANMQFYPLNLIEVYHKEPLSFMINLLIVGAVWSGANFFVQRLLVKYLSPKEILWITTPALCFFLLSCLITQSYVSFTIHFSCAVLMAALCWTNTFANVSLTAPKEIQGRIMGINQSFSAIAGLVGSLGGVVAASLHPSLIFLFGAICMVYSIHFLRKTNSQNT
jgi:predicted MFS family arabinose efflux permease